MTCMTCSKEIPVNTPVCPFCGKGAAAIKQPRVSALKIYHITMFSVYGLALLTCFICNLAVSHTLSWFYIVLASVAITFSVTNLPFLLKKHKLVLSALAVTALIYLLLFVCNVYTQGDWLLRYAYPIAFFPILFFWLILAAAAPKKINWFFKSAVISLLCGVLILTLNIWIDVVLSGNTGSFAEQLLTQFSPTGTSFFINGLISLCFFAYFFIGTILGIISFLKFRLTK